MFLTLLKTVGTARSFLLLFIYVAVLFGIPLVLLAIRLFEIMSERRREEAKRSEDESMDDAAPAGRIISASDLMAARRRN